MSVLSFKRKGKGRSSSLKSENSSNSGKLDRYQAEQIIKDKFSNLYHARDRFLKFSEQLGKGRDSEIRQDVIAHCEYGGGKQIRFDQYLSGQLVIQKIEDRIAKMIKNKRIKKNWSEEDVEILVWIVSKYCDWKCFTDIQKDLDNEDWNFIATLIPGVTPQACMFKWLSLKKVNLSTNCWSQKESQLLNILVRETEHQAKQESKDWKNISHQLYFLNQSENKIFRNAKQCKEHWNCYLNPNLKKGPWKVSEDILLLKSIQSNNGCKKWSEIVKQFDGRTENALKNRYTLIIEKQKKMNRQKSQMQIIEDYLEKYYLNQFTSDCKQQRRQSQPSFQAMLSEVEEILDNKTQVQYGLKANNLNTLTPIKIQKIEFKNFLSMNKNDLKFIQPGILTNGIFEKSADESDKSLSGSPSKLQTLGIRKYYSCVL